MYKCIPFKAYNASVDLSDFSTGDECGITLPNGTIVTGVAIKTTSAANGTSPTATVKAGSTTLGAASSIAAEAVVYNAGTAAVMTADTALTITIAGSPTAGKFGVTVFCLDPSYEAYASAGTNKADDDPYTPPEKQ